MSIISGTIGAVMGADAQGEATQAQKENNAANLEYQERIYNQQREDFKPYREIGENIAPKYTDFISGKTDITTDPLYKNAMSAATRQAVQRAAGSGQSTRSGAVQTRLAQLGQDIYNNTYQTKYQQLTDALKVGQGSAGAISNAGSSLAGNSAALTGSTNQAIQSGANATSSLYGGLGKASGSTAGAIYSIGNKAGWWNNGAADEAFTSEELGSRAAEMYAA